MTKEKRRRGPSLAALASLVSLAVALWMEVELSTALLRAVLVYLGLSMLTLAYRAILGHYLAASEARARQQLLEKAQQEAEEEMKHLTEKKEAADKEKKSAAKGAKAPAGVH